MSASLLGKVGVMILFESDKIVLTKNDAFVGKGYCNQGLFMLNVLILSIIMHLLLLLT